MKKTSLLLTTLLALFCVPIFAGQYLTPNEDGTYSVKGSSTLYRIDKDKTFEGKKTTRFNVSYSVKTKVHESYLELAEKDPILKIFISIDNSKMPSGMKTDGSTWKIERMLNDKSVKTFESEKKPSNEKGSFFIITLKKSELNNLFGECKQWVVSNEKHGVSYKIKKDFNPSAIVSGINSYLNQFGKKVDAVLKKKHEIDTVRMYDSPYDYKKSPKAIDGIKGHFAAGDVVEVYEYMVKVKDKAGNIKKSWVILRSGGSEMWGYSYSFNDTDYINTFVKGPGVAWKFVFKKENKIYDEKLIGHFEK